MRPGSSHYAGLGARFHYTVALMQCEVSGPNGEYTQEWIEWRCQCGWVSSWRSNQAVCAGDYQDHIRDTLNG